MSDVQTLATLVLGGAFDATELGENDIQPDSKLIEELQQRLVTGFDDVLIELVDRAEFDRVTAERDALQQRLNAADQRIDELERALGGMLFAFDDGVGQSWSANLLDFAREQVPAAEFKPSSGERKHGVPGTSGMRLNMLANQGELS